MNTIRITVRLILACLESHTGYTSNMRVSNDGSDIDDTNNNNRDSSPVIENELYHHSHELNQKNKNHE